MQRCPTNEEISSLPADEALFLGAALAHVAAFYERKRILRIQQQCRLAIQCRQVRA